MAVASESAESSGVGSNGVKPGSAVRARRDRAEVSDPARLQRALGVARISFKRRAAASVLDELYQQGCLKLRLPRAAGADPEAVLINTSGGLTDGDRLSVQAAFGEGTRAVVTTQACERIYRARRDCARIDTRIEAGDGARAFWLPQETILFNGGRLERTMHVELRGSAELVACEAVIFGRTAMGEEVREGRLRDAWRVERDGKLLFADHLGLDGDMAAALDRAAVGGGGRAVASIIVAGGDVRRRRDALRHAVDGTGGDVMFGCSDLGEIVLARLVAPSGERLRAALLAALRALRGSSELPRVWSC